MPKLDKTFKQGEYPEQIVNLLYNTGYRLTGKHLETQELVEGVFDTLNNNANLKTALKSMCLIYMNNTASGGKNLPKDNNGSTLLDKGISTHKIQAALLALPPIERLVLVLREILGLNYADIAEITGCEKITVTRLLTAGRGALRKHLVLHPGRNRRPEKYTAAK